MSINVRRLSFRLYSVRDKWIDGKSGKWLKRLQNGGRAVGFLGNFLTPHSPTAVTFLTLISSLPSQVLSVLSCCIWIFTMSGRVQCALVTLSASPHEWQAPSRCKGRIPNKNSQSVLSARETCLAKSIHPRILDRLSNNSWYTVHSLL